MSFNASTLEHVAPDRVVDVLTEQYEAQGDQIRTTEHNNMFDAIVDALGDLIDVCGPNNGAHYFVSINGHANPDHKHIDGWSDTHMSINITQVFPAPVEEV
jgi:hypothetical protein